VIEYLEPIAPGLDKKTFMKELETRIEAATNRLMQEALKADPSLGQGLAAANATIAPEAL